MPNFGVDNFVNINKSVDITDKDKNSNPSKYFFLFVTITFSLLSWN